MIKLKYGNTNTFYVRGENVGLIFDTDYAGTLFSFYEVIRQNNIAVRNIDYVLASHYHPDHVGIIGNLMKLGVKLLLVDVQQDYVHFSDKIFLSDKIPFVPIDSAEATIISCEESRAFLSNIAIRGQIIHTPSHSRDSISLILDDGNCLVGDLDPIEYIEYYEENKVLQSDWNKIHSFVPKRIFYAHRPEKIVKF